MTDAELAAEINTDPAALGLPALAAAHNDAAVAAALNAPTANPISLGTISKQDFVLKWAFIAVRIIGLPAALSAKWQWLFTVATQSEVVELDGALLSATRAAAIADGLCTAGEWDSVALRPASRAEVRWGVGTVVSADRVGDVFRAQRAAVYAAAQAALEARAIQIHAATPGMDMREALERADQALNGANWGHI
jgi:hypothetical protein